MLSTVSLPIFQSTHGSDQMAQWIDFKFAKIAAERGILNYLCIWIYIYK
jgi:hypothetical protein